jgi:hypothetical protein
VTNLIELALVQSLENPIDTLNRRGDLLWEVSAMSGNSSFQGAADGLAQRVLPIVRKHPYSTETTPKCTVSYTARIGNPCIIGTIGRLFDTPWVYGSMRFAWGRFCREMFHAA